MDWPGLQVSLSLLSAAHSLPVAWTVLSGTHGESAA